MISQNAARACFVMLAVLAILAGQIMPAPALTGQLIVLGAGMLVVGIPHGAIDPLLAHRLPARSPQSRAGLFFIQYLAQLVLVLLCWWLAPVATLGAFLALSAWHFGGDWRHSLGPALRLAIGAGVVLAPVAFHPQEVSALFNILAGSGATLLTNVCYWLGWVAVGIMLLAGLLTRSAQPGERLDWLLLVALAASLPPLLYFAVYFCALHSLRHLNDAAHQHARIHARAWLATALVFTALSVAGGLAFVQLAPTGPGLSERWLQAIFIGLAAVTVPHMTLIERVHRAWQYRRTQTRRTPTNHLPHGHRNH